MKTFIHLAAFAALCLPALGQTPQTWFSPTPQITEGNTVTFTSPVTVRYGQNASTCVVTYLTCIAGKATLASWLPPVTIPATAASPVTITVGVAWSGSDPVPGVYKQLQIAETATMQAVTITNNSGGKITAIVPGLPPISTTYLITCTATATVAANATMPTTLPISGSTCTAVKQ
jgi:hypothetical protein